MRCWRRANYPQEKEEPAGVGVEQPMKTQATTETDVALAARLAAMGGALSSGFPALDAALEGGFPRGEVSGLLGAPGLTYPTLRAAIAAQQREEGSGLSAWVGPGFDSAALTRIGADPSRVVVVEPVDVAVAFASVVRLLGWSSLLDVMVISVPFGVKEPEHVRALARHSHAAVVVACEEEHSEPWEAYCALTCLLSGSPERIEATVATHLYSMGASPHAEYDASEPESD